MTDTANLAAELDLVATELDGNDYDVSLTAAARLRELEAENERLRDEKDRRVYYQDIVYSVCSALDEIDGNHVSKGSGIVCGVLGSPSNEVQLRMKRLVVELADAKERIAELEARIAVGTNAARAALQQQDRDLKETYGDDRP